MEHDTLGIEHFFPGEVFVISDVPGWPHDGQGVNHEGVTQLNEGEGVVADQFVVVGGSLLASFRSKVVQLDIF